MTHSGFVSLIGAPNAGKSTLMNALVGQKVSIVTQKVQTTRSRIRGIAMAGAVQVIFVDTPGIFEPKRRLDRAMVSAAWQGADEGDVVLLIHDAARGQIDDDTKRIIDGLVKNSIKASLVLNKIDLTDPEKLLSRADDLAAMCNFERVFMVSAEKSRGTADVLSWLASQMRAGPYLFDPQDLSDMPMRLLAAEVLREKLFLNLHQELPYQLTVETEAWEEKPDGSVEVRCAIFVSREGHRGIILGKGGQALKRVGSAARLELEATLGCRVHLFTHVKYRKDWMNDPARYHDWGLDFDA